MVATAQFRKEDGIQSADIYRFSVEQYHQMISPGILQDGDPAELLEGLLLHKHPATSTSGNGPLFIDELYPLSVKQYQEMTRIGILTEDDRVELLEGVLVRKMTKKDPHIEAARRCRRAIEAFLPLGWFYEAEQPIILDSSEPEPDGVVIIGSAFDPRLMKPHPADIELVIEVSDRSLSIDRGIKLRSYARANIGCYWIINLVDRRIEVYTQPDQTSQMPSYKSCQIYLFGQGVPLMVNDEKIAAIAVADLLPIIS